MVVYEVPDSVLELLLLPQSAPPELPPREMVRSNDASDYEQLDHNHVPDASLFKSKKIREYELLIWKSLFCGILSLFVLSILVSFGVYVYSKETLLLGCATGYVYFEPTGQCYKASLSNVTFETADNSCKLENAQLASIHSAEENEFIHKLYNEKHENHTNHSDLQLAKHSLWIGLVYSNGKWKWVDGTEVDYLNWALGAQNEMNSKRRWTALITSKHNSFVVTGDEWYPLTSTEKRAFVCKKAPERRRVQMALNNSLKQAEQSTSCLSGYTYYPYTKSCYKAYPRRVHYPIAKDLCAKENSTLVSIHSDFENDFVIQLNRESHNRNENTFAHRHRIWIGLVFSNETKTWSWEDGSDVDYTNWMQNEPNNIGHEYWASIVIEFVQGTNPYGRQWLNQQWTAEESFVCKQKPM